MSFNYERWKESQLSQVGQDTTVTAAFPLSITVAGLIWAGIGVLTLGAALVLSSLAGTIRSPGTILAGLFFLFGGFRAASGASPGTLRGGVASILLGILWVSAGVIMSTAMGLQSNGMLVLISGGMGGALILAGFLAVMGRSSYQRWREAHAGRVPRSRGK
jgi:hypothetical protein